MLALAPKDGHCFGGEKNISSSRTSTVLDLEQNLSEGKTKTRRQASYAIFFFFWFGSGDR